MPPRTDRPYVRPAHKECSHCRRRGALFHGTTRGTGREGGGTTTGGRRAGLLLTIGVVGAAVTIAVAVLSDGRIPVPGLGILGAISGWLLARGIRGLRARARA
jgi:hypothetical protein